MSPWNGFHGRNVNWADLSSMRVKPAGNTKVRELRTAWTVSTRRPIPSKSSTGVIGTEVRPVFLNGPKAINVCYSYHWRRLSNHYGSSTYLGNLGVPRQSHVRVPLVALFWEPSKHCPSLNPSRTGSIYRVLRLYRSVSVLEQDQTVSDLPSDYRLLPRRQQNLFVRWIGVLHHLTTVPVVSSRAAVSTCQQVDVSSKPSLRGNSDRSFPCCQIDLLLSQLRSVRLDGNLVYSLVAKSPLSRAPPLQGLRNLAFRKESRRSLSRLCQHLAQIE